MSLWLVRILVNPRCHRVWSRGTLDGGALHRDIMRLAPDALGNQARKEANVLFRAEHTQRGLQILAQLSCAPRVDNLAPDFAHGTPECRNIESLVSSMHSGTRVRYRIDANPTKRLGNSAGDKKGRLAVLHGADAAEWWHRRAAESGLELLSATASAMPDILGSRNRDRRGRCRATSHGVTRFEGVAVVADPEKVRSAVVEGIGRARTYGCGLLSIVPVPTSGG